jgi:membrane protease YdiL (CAAX protease family)
MPSSVSGLLTSLIIILGSLGPALAAILMSAAIGGWKEVKQLLRRMVQVRAAIQWYLVAVFLPLIASLVPVLLFGGSAVVLGVLSARGAIGLLVYVLATFIDMVLGSPIGEEPGWRGFALPRLQRRHGALKGSLLLAPLWAFWHLPLFFTVWGAAYQTVGVLLGLLLFLFTVIGYTLVMTWVFNNTGGSLFLAILFHSAIDSRSTFFAVLFPQTTGNPASASAAATFIELLTSAVVWGVIALLVVACTKGRLSYKPALQEAVQTPPASPMQS